MAKTTKTKSTPKVSRLKVEEIVGDTMGERTETDEKKLVEEQSETEASETLPTTTEEAKPEPEDKEEESDKEAEGTKEEETIEEEIKEVKKGNVVISKKFLLLILFIIALISLVIGGIYRFRSQVGENPSPSPSSAPTVNTEPVATPSGDVKLSDYKVRVLNGSGVAGRAGDVADSLKEAGFAEIETGNAENYDYTDTEVQLKKDIPTGVFDAIKAALGEYTVVKGDALKESSDFDVVVIVGERS